MTLTAQAVAALAEKATPGPWAWETDELLNPNMRERHQLIIKYIPYGGQYIYPQGDDAALIAAAPSMAALIAAQAAEIERLRGHIHNIQLDCEADYPPSHGAIKYACRQALKGVKP